ncbi:FKBP-type peptidyl-prolyl cis-trans isomerase [Membranihabitans maritimus]|uniref:FKBP-type peptidyl-prolyl cis-trans isomerase n=1 Tax=Membranihabitans maritimus TaxID=2904244 RepID=UPI001F00E60B|nr:FKBP-type peptidyl-prolyl cis-trans isomerase [Membranihabitans maritimus]
MKTVKCLYSYTKYFYAFLLLPLLFFFVSSCNKTKGYKTKSGLILYIHPGHSDDTTKTRAGSILKMHYKKFVNDSLVESTFSGMPRYENVLPGFAYPHEPEEVFSMFQKGDSATVIQEADSLLKKQLFYSVPQYVEAGDKIITHYKILDVLGNDSLARLDQEKEFENVKIHNKKNGPARIRKYLKDRNIQAKMTPDSVFIQVIKEGNGVQVDSGQLISLRFKATTFSGEQLGSNMDEESDPMKYKVKTGYMIDGVDDGLCALSEGSSAILYIPAMKGFGSNSPPGITKGFQDLIFEVKIEDIEEVME